MKMSIEWHKEVLGNMENSLSRLLKEQQTLNTAVQSLQDKLELKKLQIETAIKRGKDGFDEERFLIPKIK